MVKAIIFDFDGVILNTSQFNLNLLRDIFRKKGISFSDKDYHTYFVGRPLKDSLQDMLAGTGRESEIEGIFAMKKQYDQYFTEETRAYPDALEFLRKCQGRFRMMVATGSRPIHLEMAFRKYGLEGVFETTLTSDYSTRGKPDPEIYALSLRKLHLSPKDAVVVEDAPAGILSAKGAGMRCIAVTHTYPAIKLKEADLIVNKLTDSQVEPFLLG